MSFQLDNLIIWVTGGSRGIGAAIGKRLAQANATVVLTARSLDSFAKLRDEFKDLRNLLILPCDVSSAEQIGNTYENIKSQFGRVDVLVNNAGVARFAPLAELTVEDFDYMNSVNYRGAFLCIKQVLPQMIDRGCGIIVNIVSQAAVKTYINSSLYSASKAAVLAMSRTLREEVRQHGISIIDILPGATETDIWSTKALENYRHRMMKPEDVAETVFDAIKLAAVRGAVIEEVLVRPQLGDI